VYSLFEITLSSIDSKLFKIDKMERAFEQLKNKIDAVDARLSDSAARSDAMLDQLQSVESRLAQMNSRASGLPAAASTNDNLAPHILALDEKVSLIGSKLNVLAYQLDTNSLWWNLHNETGSDYAAESSEQKRYVLARQNGADGGGKEPTARRTPADTATDTNFGSATGRSNRKNRQNWSASGTSTNNQEVDTLRASMSSMDRHLKILIELFSEQMDKMLTAVGDVRSSLLDTPVNGSDARPTTPEPFTTATPSGPKPKTSQSKLDALYAKMAPLLEVSEKMDQVWNVLVGTKSSVDELVPTQEALLWQTQRQERAISDIQSDLNVKAKQIIENLNLVVQQQQRAEISAKQRAKGSTFSQDNETSQEPIPMSTTTETVQESKHRPSESQLHLTTFKQSESLKSLIRAQELTPKSDQVKTDTKSTSTSSSTSTTSTTSRTSTTAKGSDTNKTNAVEETLTLPTDIMDSEFLHDDPLAGDVQNQTTTTTTETPKKVEPMTTTTTATTTTTTTTTGRTVSYVPPAGPTKRSRVPTNSSVVFPSVKNKPGFINSTYFYDYTEPQNIGGYSCAELKEQGITKSGIYYLLIRGTSFWYIKVHCDMETAKGGWTVIQRRDDYGEDRENFNRDWDDYKSGFGNPDGEFWLGNENIYMLTNAEDYSLRVELEDFEGNIRFAEYSSFKLYSEREQYKLEIGGYTGDAGDSLNDPWYGSNLSPFSTYNQDNDRSSLNCASMLKGGWWWKSCGRGLNGIYLTDPQDLTARQGIVWFRWRGWDYTLKRATMMIRPRYYGLEPPTSSTL